jgi:hypothetical protein
LRDDKAIPDEEDDAGDIEGEGVWVKGLGRAFLHITDAAECTALRSSYILSATIF